MNRSSDRLRIRELIGRVQNASPEPSDAEVDELGRLLEEMFARLNDVRTLENSVLGSMDRLDALEARPIDQLNAPLLDALDVAEIRLVRKGQR